MRSCRFTIPAPPNFNFWRTVYSHGWCLLPPFAVEKPRQSLQRLLELSDGTLMLCHLTGNGNAIRVEANATSPLTNARRAEARGLLKSCLRITEDFGEFYREASRHRQFHWITVTGAGRLLRAPSVFEDAVKMICTTNCSWALTEVMVGNLTRAFGRRYSEESYTFPTPRSLAASSEAFLRKEIRAGYRSPYLLEFAERVASGSLDVESWRTSQLPTDALFAHVRSVKGIGDYAAGNILKLLGRYDYLGLDSWVRRKYAEVHRNGRRVSDRTIERHYKPLGRWRGLFFWLEMTKHWYNSTFPF